MLQTMPLDRQKKIPLALLGWYGKHRRNLPWRLSRDPYKIWVSEIMLQQTQVETVLPYYERWMKAFPDVFSLARAPESKVLKFWEGLGYYSRAKNLRRAAQTIVDRYRGTMPRSEARLRQLPGIGKYTAGAILSIAWNQHYPVVDGNVSRVLARLFYLKTNPRSSAHQKRLWDIATQMLPRGRSGDFNQALMELGATLCKPKNPACLLCPIQRFCRAHQLGREEEVPLIRARPKTEIREAACALLSKNGKFLIVQFPAGELWAGLWGLPEVRKENAFDLEKSLCRRLGRLGIKAGALRKVGSLKRSYTRYRETLHVFAGEAGHEKLNGSETVRWVSPSELKRFAFPAAHARIIRNLWNYASKITPPRTLEITRG